MENISPTQQADKPEEKQMERNKSAEEGKGIDSEENEKQSHKALKRM